MFKNYQKGVSLYLALMIMFILIAIGLGISLIIVSQMKMIRGMGDSVVAFYAADTGIEHALYDKRRKGGTGEVSGSLDANTSYTVYSNTEEGKWMSVGNFKIGGSSGVKRSVEITIPGCSTVTGGACPGLIEADCTNCNIANCQWNVTPGGCSGNNFSCPADPVLNPADCPTPCCYAVKKPGFYLCFETDCSELNSATCSSCDGCAWTPPTSECTGTLDCPDISSKTNCNSCTQCQWIF